MDPKTVIQELADFFRILGDPTRIRILEALAEGEWCVQELETRLGMSQSAVSHQLKVLKQARLVRHRKDGKNVYYILDDAHVATVFHTAREHVTE